MVQMLREDFINDGYLTTILGVEAASFLRSKGVRSDLAAVCCGQLLHEKQTAPPLSV
jgi:hypothetical protein